MTRVVTMYVDRCKYKNKGGTYERILLRESYREGGKVKKRTIANISKCTEEEIKTIEKAVKLNGKVGKVDIDTIRKNLNNTIGLTVGAVFVLNEIAKRVGICKALGKTRLAKLALWLIIARIIDQGSRLSSVRLAQRHAACDVLDLDKFNEDDLYQALDWLAEHQDLIEDRLFKKKFKNKKPTLFLYDVTSSYFEGKKAELSAFGYSRDKKTGKMQIVIGLLTDGTGDPLTIEVFKGNTQDPQTVHSQVKKIIQRFNCKYVTLVGDRGMIKSKQIEELNSHDFHFITGITKPQIRAMINKDVFQLSLFDETLCEIEYEDIRYILRRNPVRAKEEEQTRKSKLATLQMFLQKKNQYLADHPKAGVQVAVRNVKLKITKLKLSAFVSVESDGRVLKLLLDDEQRQKCSELDGCYSLKTDLPAEIDKATIHERYKDLKYVEGAFRTIKTTLLEVRPLYVIKESRIRGHVLEAMLAYKIVRVLREAWKDLDLTVEEAIDELSSICSLEYTIDTITFNEIPIPRPLSQELLAGIEVTLPPFIPNKGIEIVPRKKIKDERKSS